MVLLFIGRVEPVDLSSSVKHRTIIGKDIFSGTVIRETYSDRLRDIEIRASARRVDRERQ